MLQRPRLLACSDPESIVYDVANFLSVVAAQPKAAGPGFDNVDAGLKQLSGMIGNQPLHHQAMTAGQILSRNHVVAR